MISRVSSVSNNWYGISRGFAKDSNGNNHKRNNKEESETRTGTGTVAGEKQPQQQQQSKGPQPFLQHQEWVKFQQSIRVDGFQTGQITSATTLKKNRGGKQARNRKARELALMQQGDPRFADSTDKFPAIRYSPEETEELLKLAFDTLPKKTGKRGTRNLKRQNRRWKLVREIRAKYKRQIMAAHERRMQHRKWKREQTKAMKEAAPEICNKDTEYRAQVLRRWAATMFPTQPTGQEEKVVSVKE